jgi:2-polyprenyl-6-methoxyphenol hydroxylase-like FAD-dependent oxidoreductase
VRALVIGGGIAGLATATALRRAGLEPAVFESAERFDPLGAGLSLWANAVQALDRLGLGEQVRSKGAVAERTLVRSRRGEVLSEVDLRGIRGDSVGIHRADLQEVLLEPVRDAVRFGKRCVGVRDDGPAAVARFEDGSEEKGDVLIGADGLRSVVRAAFLGGGGPHYAGYVGWRAVTPLRAEWSVDCLFQESWGRGVRFGLVDIGGGRLYWFVSETAPESNEERPTGRKERLLELVRGWHDPAEAVVEATDEETIFRTSIYDRKPVSRWSSGRIGLVGDAAHVMTPNLGQGAAQAIEDAVVLGAAFAAGQPPAAALSDYVSRRRRRANMLVRRSRQMGRIAQASSSLGATLRDRLVRAMPAGQQRAQLARIVEADLPV